MREVVDQLRAAQIRGWLGTRPRWNPYSEATASDFERAEKLAGVPLPADLVEFLSLAGFGDIAEDDLSFRAEWFRLVEFGSLKGAVLFAQDVLGSFYAFVPTTNRIVYFSRGEPGFAELALNFGAFIKELQQRSYELLDWVDSLELMPYDWSAV